MLGLKTIVIGYIHQSYNGRDKKLLFYSKKYCLTFKGLLKTTMNSETYFLYFTCGRLF